MRCNVTKLREKPKTRILTAEENVEGDSPRERNDEGREKRGGEKRN